jgi:hypothetical protein
MRTSSVRLIVGFANEFLKGVKIKPSSSDA